MKKVIINSDGYYPKCPTCGYADLSEGTNNCPECGEELDWKNT
jgi:endogenous inhibitor of DNA gyrase (YacG/DUF329 family)